MWCRFRDVSSRSLGILVLTSAAAAAFAGCASPEEAADEVVDQGLTLHREDVNGLWRLHRGASTTSEDAVFEAWPAIGVRLDLGGARYSLTPSGSHLSASSPLAWALTTHPNDDGYADDVVDGTLAGVPVRFERDVAPKPPITMTLPGDRPFRPFLVDQLALAAQRDRESYVVLHTASVRSFLHDCVLFQRGTWQYKFMAGADRPAETAALENVVDAIEGATTTPRLLLHEPRFADAVKANVRAPFLASYALSELGLYVSTAAGRSVHIPIGNDALIYFVTDRPDRAEKLGVVVTKTALHAPFASSFGGQLLDLASMPDDNALYARTMMDLLGRSSAARAAQLSPAGRSALTDWFGIMAIEDYRGVAFGHPNLGWGYNFTNAQFYGLVVRALARPGASDSAGRPVVGQVIVGNELRPGDPSYADVLNKGKDMQEYPDMAALKQLATGYLLERHAAEVDDVVQAFAGVVPASDLDDRARYDVFHFIAAELYDTAGRTANLTPSAANAATAAVGRLFEILDQESAALEAYILDNGVTKSSERAPKANAF